MIVCSFVGCELGFGLEALRLDASNSRLSLGLLRRRTSLPGSSLAELRGKLGGAHAHEKLAGFDNRATIDTNPFDEALHLGIKRHILVSLQLAGQPDLPAQLLRHH